jgi:hypothetical protein
MSVSDYVGVAVFGGFGLWWLLFPKSVISFYTWFHRGRVSLPLSRQLTVRIVGGLWTALVLALAVFGRK